MMYGLQLRSEVSVKSKCQGTIIALDALTGTKRWRLFFNNKNFTFIGASSLKDDSFVNVCSQNECMQINPKTGEFQNTLRESDLTLVSSIKTPAGHSGFAAVDSNLMVFF
jgi:outer membrane protein assembly factor BamB